MREDRTVASEAAAAARSASAPGYGVLADRSPVDHELEIRRSRFLCRLQRVESEDEAREVIADRRAAHRLARHHCSAFVLGADRRVQRTSDDGEPAGTAGTPMLEALVLAERVRGGAAPASDLSDVVAVVTRYFGGVLLGAGGLVRAYSESVSSTLQLARTVTRQSRAMFAVEAPHATAGRWENDLRSRGVLVVDTEYAGSAATLTVAVPDAPDARARLASDVASVTAGAGELLELGTQWVDLS